MFNKQQNAGNCGSPPDQQPPSAMGRQEKRRNVRFTRCAACGTMTKDLRAAGESTEPWGGEVPLCMNCAARWRLATGREIGKERKPGEGTGKTGEGNNGRGRLIRDGRGRVIGSSVWNGQGSLLTEGRDVEQLALRSGARMAIPVRRTPVP